MSGPSVLALRLHVVVAVGLEMAVEMVVVVMVTPDPRVVRGSVAVPDSPLLSSVCWLLSAPPSQLAGTPAASPAPLVILISVSQSVSVVTGSGEHTPVTVLHTTTLPHTYRHTDIQRLM